MNENENDSVDGVWQRRSVAPVVTVPSMIRNTSDLMPMLELAVTSAARSSGRNAIPDVSTINNGASSVTGIWKLTVAAGVASFTNCFLPRGVMVKILDGDAGSTLTYDMSEAGEATEWYLGVLWNTQTGHASINGAATFAGIVDQEMPEDSEFVKGPICKMAKSGDTWSEADGEDYRMLLIGVLYT